LTELREKSLCLVYLLFVIFLPLSKSLNFTCDIALNLFYILKDQLSEED
jgi:hypothetical protein